MALSLVVAMCFSAGVYAKPRELLDDGKIEVTCDHRRLANCQQAAESGDPDAMLHMAMRSQRGLGVKKSPMQTVQWLRRAAEQAHPVAHFVLAWHLRNGIGTGRDEPQAFKHYRAAADLGNVVAQYLVGDALVNGRGVKVDEALGHAYFIKSVESDYAPAMTAVGCDFETGRGVKQDYGQAISWYEKVDVKASPEASYRLAMIYKSGRGVDPDPKEAIRLLRKAANANFALAQWTLVGILEHGDIGIRPDPRGVLKWLERLTKLGHREGQMKLANLKREAYKKLAKQLERDRFGIIKNAPNSAVRLEGWIEQKDGTLWSIRRKKNEPAIFVNASRVDDSRCRETVFVHFWGIIDTEKTVEALVSYIPNPIYEVSRPRVRIPAGIVTGRTNRFVVEGHVENVGNQLINSLVLEIDLDYPGEFWFASRKRLTLAPLKIGEKRQYSVAFDVYIPRYPGAFNLGLVTASWREVSYDWPGSASGFRRRY